MHARLRAVLRPVAHAPGLPPDRFRPKNCLRGYSGVYTCFVINGQYAYNSESEYGKIGYRGLSYRETPVYDLDVMEVFGGPCHDSCAA